MEEEFEQPDPHGPVLISIWIGAVVLWIFKGFRGKLKEQLVRSNENRNIWTGYLLQLIVVSILVYFAYKNKF